MNRSELSSNYSLFGNRGSVANSSVHITKVGLNTTLCGTPMPSHNWANEMNIMEAGCEHCISIYKKENPPVEVEKEWFGYSAYYARMIAGTDGSFAKSLAEAWLNAAAGNRETLVKAFPRIFCGNIRYY